MTARPPNKRAAPSSPGPPTARVVVSEDRASARLILPADLPREQITLEFCLILLRDRGVECTAAVRQSLSQLLSDLPPLGQPIDAAVAQARAPVAGEDGRIEWLLDAPCDESQEAMSFYDRSPYVMVQAGQIIGRQHPPTLGEDGRDVLGGTAPAKPGKPAPWTLNPTILVNSRGDIIAQVQGMLDRTAGKARISQVLTVEDYVDFSTGHINFEGDVVIAQGIRDRFEVQAKGSIEVRGLIEAAYLTCGENLLALGGMAGRERGKVAVGNDLVARYLDGILGEVGGNLHVERELINAQLTVEGDARIGKGAVIGGRLIVGGRVEARALGSPAGTATHLSVGAVPSLERAIARLDQLIHQVSQRRDALLQEQQALQKKSRPTPQDSERQTEMLYQLQQLAQALNKALPGRDHLERARAERRVVDVRVAGTLYHGVTLEVGPRRYLFGDELRGPIRITADAAGAPRYQSGAGPSRPLAELDAVRVTA